MMQRKQHGSKMRINHAQRRKAKWNGRGEERWRFLKMGASTRGLPPPPDLRTPWSDTRESTRVRGGRVRVCKMETGRPLAGQQGYAAALDVQESCFLDLHGSNRDFSDEPAELEREMMGRECQLGVSWRVAVACAEQLPPTLEVCLSTESVEAAHGMRYFPSTPQARAAAG
jgi:hypothetical protein